MLSWLALHTPTDPTTKALFQQMVLTIFESQKSHTHENQQVFQKYDPASLEERAKQKSKKEKAASYFWVKVPWQREELQTLGLHTLLNSKDIQDLYPVSSENGKVKVSYSLAVPNGLLPQNYGKVSREADVLGEVPPEVPSPNACACQKYRTQHAIDFRGHVATVDPEVIHNERLRSYWLKGRKFRCQAHPQGLLDSFAKSLENTQVKLPRETKRTSKLLLPGRHGFYRQWEPKWMPCSETMMPLIIPFCPKRGLMSYTRFKRKWFSPMQTIHPMILFCAANPCTNGCCGKSCIVTIMCKKPGTAKLCGNRMPS